MAVLSMSDAVVAGASADELARLDPPAEYLAAHLRVEDEESLKHLADKDVRRTLRVGPVPMPELAPDEVLVAVMASSVNYNTVWSATFEPVSTFGVLRRYGRLGGWAARHDQPFHALGTDASGIVVRTGSAVRYWRIGDHVVVNGAAVDEQDAMAQMDGMLGEHQRAWGYETNYGGLGHYAIARATQVVRKPAHLTWEESASLAACGATAYRMLVSDRGARMKQGDVVLIWGASGGLGAYAIQLVRNGGGIPVGVVSSESKAAAARALGCDVVINRTEIGIGDDDADDNDRIIAAGKRLGGIIRKEVGEDPHIVFEHVGRSTFGISVYVVRRGGAVVTCGSSTGYEHRFDNRYLWMNLKRIIGSHIANVQELAEFTRLCDLGLVHPVLTDVYPLADIGEATRQVQCNRHIGKIGVLCLAPEPGLGVTDPARRARIGAEAINPLRGFAAAAEPVGAAR